MRSDMKQVIIERPRRGGHGARRPGKVRYFSADQGEDASSQESVHRWYGWENKEQSDSFNPMYGFLRSRVGQPWDKVWSEVCEHNKDHMGKHLRRHMLEIMEINTALGPNGEILDSKGMKLDGWRWGGQFYVHPVTRLLCENKPTGRRYRKAYPQKQIVSLGGQDYYKHNGIWWRVKTERVEEPVRASGGWWPTGIPKGCYYVNDVFGNASGYFLSVWEFKRALERAYGELIYCTSKQQAGKRECRKLNQLSP